MRAPQKLGPRSVTRRDPMPRYGATLEIFDALDVNDLAPVIALLDVGVTGRIVLPQHNVITFTSRDEYVKSLGPIVEGLRRAGIESKTRISNYDVSSDSVTTVASLDLHRMWLAGSTGLNLRGHATLVWRTSPGPALITHWRITWENARDPSGDWPSGY